MEIRDSNEIGTLSEIPLGKYDYKESDVQQAILKSPESTLHEDIFAIGDEIGVGPWGEQIDILGMDSDLNTCIVEIKATKLKRDHVKQAIKYAPYVANFGEERFEKEFQGPAEEFHGLTSKQSEQGTPINEDQRLLLVAPEVAPRTIHMIDWLQSQGVELELILFTVYDHPTEEKAILSTHRRTVDPDELPEKDVKKWNKSKKKAKEHHLEIQASQATSSLIREIIDKIGEQPELKGPDWQQKNYISFGDRNVRVKVRPYATKVGVWFIYGQGEEFHEENIRKRIEDVEQITVNTEKNRVEFDLAPDTDERTLDSLVQFVSDEL